MAASGNQRRDFVARRYVYDGENRLIAVEPTANRDAATVRYTYGYDYLGRRIWKATEPRDPNAGGGAWDPNNPTALTKFIYDGWRIDHGA